MSARLYGRLAVAVAALGLGCFAAELRGGVTAANITNQEHLSSSSSDNGTVNVTVNHGAAQISADRVAGAAAEAALGLVGQQDAAVVSLSTQAAPAAMQVEEMEAEALDFPGSKKRQR